MRASRRSHQILKPFQQRDIKKKDYKRVPIETRISLLYDFQEHRMDLKQLSEKYNLTQSTLRNLVTQFRSFGHVDTQNYKKKISKGAEAPRGQRMRASKDAREESDDHVSDLDHDENEPQLSYQRSLDRPQFQQGQPEMPSMLNLVPGACPKEQTPFIKRGPQVLDPLTQRTSCSLLLYSDNEQDIQRRSLLQGSNQQARLKVLRVGIDSFSYDVNFGELPNIDDEVYYDRDREQNSPNQIEERNQKSTSPQSPFFDERLQFQCLLRKKQKVFKHTFKFLNYYSGALAQQPYMNLSLPYPESERLMQNFVRR